jgi:hypothetical protein
MYVQTTLFRPLGGGAQWGWTAPFFDGPPSLADDRLEAMHDLLLSRVSTDELQSFLRPVHRRLWNHIGQDELAPTKADCSQALRELLRQLNKLDRKLNTLTTRARYTFSIALAEEASQGGVVSMPLVLQRIYEAASRRNHRSKHFHALAEAAAVALVYYESLDFKSLGVVQQAAMRRDLRSSLCSPEGPYCFGIFVRRLALYRGRIKLALNDLKSRPGPDIPDSLHILVWTLADYYAACTAKPVTNSAARDHSYTAKPQSQAGRFVVACVKALVPPADWFPSESTKDALNRTRLFIDGMSLERAILYSLRLYVDLHPDTSRRGRRKQAPTM